MAGHNLFYYPYASFTDAQLPLLKVAALYFDKLYVLDPEAASGGTVGVGDLAQDVRLLEDEGILVRVSPEEILEKYEMNIAEAVRDDLGDEEFLSLCERSGKYQHWTLALAKVPREIRDDPLHQDYTVRKPRDRAMQQLMGELPRSVLDGPLQYRESYIEVTQRLYSEQFVYDEQRYSGDREIEYRYADYPLPLGEAIMMNHALFASLLHAEATPITDDQFHSQVLRHKLARAVQDPAIQNAIADRVKLRQLKEHHLVVEALTDAQIKLPVLNPELPLSEILEYRGKHESELGKARTELGLMARRVAAEPWTADFANTLESETIPDLIETLREAEKKRDEWLGSQRTESVLKAAGVGVGAAAAVLAIFAAPVTPVALAIAGLSMVSGTAIPGVEWLNDWRDGKKALQENGLHYLLQPIQD